MDQLMSWFDAGKCASDGTAVERFWSGHGRCLASAATSQHVYRQLRRDQDMLQLVGPNLQAQARLPGINLPSLSPDFGTISVPRYWGGTVHWPEGGNIFLSPAAASVEEALKLTPRRPQDPDMDAARAVGLFRRACADLGTDQLWCRTPDVQGPLNAAGMIVRQEELLMAMHTEPSQVHALLERVCTFLIEMLSFLRRETRDRICGNIWPYAFLPIARGLCFTEDLMPLLSTESYRRFAVPYLRRLDQAFGGLLIHCCGDWGRHARTLVEADLNILAVEFHYPFTRLEELACLADRAVFIPYIMLNKQKEFASVAEYYRQLLDRARPGCRFWFACCDDSPEMQTFVTEASSAS